MSTNQSWGGRFAEGPREAVAAYTDSQTYDRALYAQDIRGSQAHARMLGRQGVITPDEAEQIVNGLDAVKQEIESGAFVCGLENISPPKITTSAPTVLSLPIILLKRSLFIYSLYLISLTNAIFKSFISSGILLEEIVW